MECADRVAGRPLSFRPKYASASRPIRKACRSVYKSLKTGQYPPLHISITEATRAWETVLQRCGLSGAALQGGQCRLRKVDRDATRAAAQLGCCIDSRQHVPLRDFARLYFRTLSLSLCSVYHCILNGSRVKPSDLEAVGEAIAEATLELAQEVNISAHLDLLICFSPSP